MEKHKIAKFLAVTVAILSSATVFGDENGGNIIYLGVGSAKTGSPYESSKTPISLGYLNISSATDTVWGVDISGEGTMLDSTWGQNKSVNQANSYNLLIGKNINKSETFRLDGAFLIGLRESTSDCPSSYLGYQCYANESPKTNYGLNYGVVIAATYKTLMLGVRATGKSTQGLVGMRF